MTYATRSNHLLMWSHPMVIFYIVTESTEQGGDWLRRAYGDRYLSFQLSSMWHKYGLNISHKRYLITNSCSVQNHIYEKLNHKVTYSLPGGTYIHSLNKYISIIEYKSNSRSIGRNAITKRSQDNVVDPLFR